MRIQENLLNHSHKYQGTSKQKLPSQLFDTREFYNDLHDKNLSTPDLSFKNKTKALDSRRSRLYGNPKYKNRPIENLKFTQTPMRY